ncbi:hypothetical protein LOTGIDRAFT_163140 [Lottia gigantea]|uniref:Uncharacterized protein n=1 Tax=Lottia gigantea TaxID=225164 RepID=V4A9M9_LOTGI|nr:hypothetical protein LOTGIDRAFT_163140 [Lottia gigantea]ESO91780.1 hypothetical protein LOTGIDRAFT_163140 [Lottia gigantea]
MAANGGCNLQSCSSKTTRSQSAFAKLEFHAIKDDRIKLNTSTVASLACRKTYSTDSVGSRSFEHRLLSPHLNSIYCSGSAEIPFHFIHHNRYQDHMHQYREQYTHRRLKSLRSNINEYRSYQGMLSAPQILQRPTLKPATATKTSNSAVTSVVRCFDVFDSMKNLKVNDNSLKPTHKRPIKKKIWKSEMVQVRLKQPEINQPVIEVQCHQSGGIKMDDGGGLRRMFTSEDLLPSEPETCHRLSPNNANKLHLHCRSRPSIPSKTRGSKRDQPSYVVTYKKK